MDSSSDPLREGPAYPPPRRGTGRPSYPFGRILAREPSPARDLLEDRERDIVEGLAGVHGVELAAQPGECGLVVVARRLVDRIVAAPAERVDGGGVVTAVGWEEVARKRKALRASREDRPQLS
jgi:hypothetical protein